MTDPRWLKLARTDLGIRETPGVANNPVLMKRFSSITKALGIFYNADSVPWCGAMMAWWMTQSLIAPPAIAVRAKSWATWGSNLAADKLAPGAVLVFEREGGGHVAMYVGEDSTHYHCLGGNQGDAISITRIAKSRCVARRWPKGEPVIGGSVKLTAAGASVSRGEG
jgi:uncharacterized protein (TIGR02594 family)